MIDRHSPPIAIVIDRQSDNCPAPVNLNLCIVCIRCFMFLIHMNFLYACDKNNGYLKLDCTHYITCSNSCHLKRPAVKNTRRKRCVLTYLYSLYYSHSVFVFLNIFHKIKATMCRITKLNLRSIIMKMKSEIRRCQGALQKRSGIHSLLFWNWMQWSNIEYGYDVQGFCVK